MKTTLIATAVAGLAAAASAQTITFDWMADKTNVLPGETVTVTLRASWDPANVGLASTLFEIMGDDDAFASSLGIDVTEGAGDTQLSFLGRNPSFRTAGTFPPYVNGDDITADPSGIDTFQLPQQFNGNFNPDNPIDLFKFTWTTSDGTARMVTYTSVHDNADVYTDGLGSSIPYTPTINPVSWNVVPAPASAALLGLGMVTIRRRR